MAAVGTQMVPLVIIQRQIDRDANLHTTVVLVVKGKGKKEGGELEYVEE